MAFEGMLSKMGSDMKHLTDRYAEYGAPMQDPHLLYTYEPAGPTHEAASKHQYGGGNKNNAAMSALTLLAFLFFLHILQQCIKDHMVAMSTPQITIMTAGREGDDALKKHAKIDKAGFTDDVDLKTKEAAANKGVVNQFDADDVMKSDEYKYLMKINTADPPNGGGGAQTYDYGKVYDERRSAPVGFVSAMADDQQ